MEAITREEKIMSGENLTPITRKEMFLAKAAGQNIETPEPITREEIFLSKIGGGSGGVTINNQDKTITENGVYQADEGYTGLGTVTVEVASTGGGDIDALIDGSITEVSSEATSVRQYAFYNNANIVTANLPKAKTIGEAAFQNCSKLANIDISSATKISSYAFYGTPIKSLVFNSDVDIGVQSFIVCRSLITVKCKGRLSFASNESFKLCSNLTTVDTVTVKPNLNNFAECTNLNIFIIRGGMLPLSSVNAFSNTGIANGTGYFYVPREQIDGYKSATNWSTYATQFRALEDYTVDGTINGELDESKI